MTMILPFYNNLAGHGDCDYGLMKKQKEEVVKVYNDILRMGVNSPIRAMEKALKIMDDENFVGEVMRDTLVSDALKDKQWLDKASRRLWHPREVEKFSGRFGDMIIISRLAKFGPLTLGPLNSLEVKDIEFWVDMENRHAFAGNMEYDHWVLVETQEIGVLDDSFNKKWRLITDACGMKFFDWTA